MSDKAYDYKEIILGPIFANNPIGLQVLGICSALAVTGSMKTAFLIEHWSYLCNRLFQPVRQYDPQQYSGQHPHYRANGGCSLGGYRC